MTTGSLMMWLSGSRRMGSETRLRLRLRGIPVVMVPSWLLGREMKDDAIVQLLWGMEMRVGFSGPGHGEVLVIVFGRW